MTEKGTMTELSTNHGHSVTFTKHPDHYISFMSYERLHREEHFYIKKWLCGIPRFHNTPPQKCSFLTAKAM